jgi:hypothetical protein
MIKKGFLIVELLLVFSMSAFIMTGIAAFSAVQRESLSKSINRQMAVEQIKQQLERAKSLWSQNWISLPTGQWHTELADDKWALVAGSVPDGKFTKSLTVEPVLRDSSGQIVDTGGYLDPSSLKVTSRAEWSDPNLNSLSEVLFLTNYLKHGIWTEDIYDDFIDGTEDATDITTNPGFVQLAQTGGGGSWTKPRSLGTVDGERKASGICTNGQYLYLAQDYNFGRIQVFNIEDNPELPSSKGSFTVTYKPNDCAVSNGYLYLADNFILWPSMSIYNIGANPVNPPYIGYEYTLLATKALAADSRYLFASINNSNVVRAYRLENGHYTNPELLGFFSTSHNIASLALSGNYLYVAQKNTAKAIRIYNISSNPASPQLIGTVPLLYEPTGVAVDDNILHVSMNNKTGAMLSLANPIAPQLYGYYPTERNSADITANGDYGYVAGADSQQKVIEIFNISDSKGLSGINFIYGEYTSSTFSLAKQVSYYRLSWEGTEVANTDILFQTAVNNDNTTWNFIGPDGTAGTYFDSPGVISPPESVGLYMKYKIILTGDGQGTPVVDKVTVSYAE